MKKNKLFNMKIFIWILFFPVITSVLGVAGIYLGSIVAFFKTDFLSLDVPSSTILNTIKSGIIIGLLLGLSLWIWGIVIPELTKKFKSNNKDDSGE
ncbi:hypothetical protein QMU90_003403 [Edwardsiella ictaluri]|uniref:MotA/TolQ/ExbB proton channel domain-containing protein n=1 Tax=Edwardsiella ictaluri TaxID=67780 RepID=A0ABY8GIG3_EDWIC|nr:hypothetical protein [Edwardsiella ictaluri]ELV7529456.1 hypothetical protein [Edwardsiella ictaluri]WFN97235.1 hypothetical protein MAY91_03880 [Edwardsiella ictaluri]